MRLGVNMLGSKATRDSLSLIGARSGEAANFAVIELAERTLEKVVDSIEGGPKTGRIYQRYNPARVHQASAPGQAPADDLGALAASYEIILTRINQYAMRATVGSSLAYAAAMEFGNPDTNLLPRPHLEPAARKVEEEIGGILIDAIRVMTR